jgi:hypothetical protein
MSSGMARRLRKKFNKKEGWHKRHKKLKNKRNLKIRLMQWKSKLNKKSAAFKNKET